MKVDSLKNEHDKVLLAIGKKINPAEQPEEEVTTIPEIDGLQNNLVPNVKFVAASPRNKLGQNKRSIVHWQ